MLRFASVFNQADHDKCVRFLLHNRAMSRNILLQNAALKKTFQVQEGGDKGSGKKIEASKNMMGNGDWRAFD